MLPTSHAAPPCPSLLPPVFDCGTEIPDVPRELEHWPLHAAHSGPADPGERSGIAACLARAQRCGGWQWPARPLVFLSDTHADAEGFHRSLLAAGVIRRTPGCAGGMELTDFGKTATIVVGGDCLDKGPSNLDMLDALGHLFDMGADMRLLAGNHDLRMRIVVEAVRQAPTPLSEHLFLRMGRKILPALREVLDRFVHPDELARLGSEAECAARLLPGEGWQTRFLAASRGVLSPQAAAREIEKIVTKRRQFDKEVARCAMSYREMLAAMMKCHEIFFSEGGKYAWFFQRMDAVAHAGSLLFVHAGLCDESCALLARGGPQAVNAAYRRELARAPVPFYFGPLANIVRTKYRATDCALTGKGAVLLEGMGIHLIVQGHVNNHQGQRLLAKNGVLHLESDVTLDRASRSREGLSGIGAGATLILPSGDVIGLSRDYPRAKHFAPERLFSLA